MTAPRDKSPNANSTLIVNKQTKNKNKINLYNNNNKKKYSQQLYFLLSPSSSLNPSPTTNEICFVESWEILDTFFLNFFWDKTYLYLKCLGFQGKDDDVNFWNQSRKIYPT